MYNPTIMKKITVLFVALLTALSLNAQNRKLTLDNVVSGTFYGTSVGNITPMADGESFLQAQGDCILKYSFKTGEVTDTVLNLRTARGERLFSLGSSIHSRQVRLPTPFSISAQHAVKGFSHWADSYSHLLRT